MSTTVIVRYRTRPETADENAGLVERVFAPLDETAPDGISYCTYRLADGVTFLHVAELSGPQNPLTALEAFGEFQRDLTQRCVDPPAPGEATLVGSYGCVRAVGGDASARS